LENRNMAPSSLKSPGNQAQYDSNLELLGNLTSVLTALEEGETAEVDACIRRAIAAVLERQKLVKIADASEAGWLTVSEYVGNAVALDEKDDRKINRAEPSALAKREKRFELKRSRGGKHGRGKYQNTGHNNGHERDVYFASQQLSQHVPQCPQYVAAPPPPPQYYAQYFDQQPQKQLGPCFHCYGPHMKNACPELRRKKLLAQQQIESQYAQQ
jgi:hypothetical protein